ncbi:hypothetical protein DIS18_09065 [Algibacter marinivivus]|uniref:SGNH/GDSL hydrolase family protein n=1 Tax=Algibacter marinivivus TaxID=2100723 RepID=A0A2U2X3M8_9FLAO|nr:hypothetical protein [Algibacter marinivivus]PWH82393.1 hypothetical protein DIS18_09065 [Algibacter marinivivus]
MKKILIKLIPYLVVFLLINIICYKTSDFFKQENKYLDRIETTINSQSEIIFLGDSHVETIKLLELSDNIGNLAFGGDGINEMYIKILTMIENNKSLEYVFIATEPQIFNNTLSSNSTFLNKYLFQIDNELNIYNKSKLNLLTERVPLLNDSYLKFVLNKIYSNFKPESTDLKKSWVDYTSLERIEIATKTGKIDHSSIMSNEKYLKTYKQIVEICKSKKIKVIGIRFPVNSNYLNQCKKNDLIKVDSFIKELKLYKHLDYSNRMKDPKYFHDEDHLNKKGVKKLSEIIYSDSGIKLTN